jgi:hypothetical protein
MDPTAALRTLEELCPGCPPRPVANALALVMRDRGLQMQPARAFLAGLPPGEAAALQEEVRAAKAEYSARLRAYCCRRDATGCVVGVERQRSQEHKTGVPVAAAGKEGGKGKRKRASKPSTFMMCI